MQSAVPTTPTKPTALREPGCRHWSETLPPGNGKSAFAGVWKIPAVVAAAIAAGLTIRGWR